jgi:hypothetical protein
MYWRVALLILLATTTPQAKADPPDEQALRLLNHYRQIAGLTPVKLDRQLSAGCMEHANYMVQNQGTDAMAGLNPHTQHSNLPGASEAGAACAKAADIFIGVSDLRRDRRLDGRHVSPPSDTRSTARAYRRGLCSSSRWDADGGIEV